MKIVFAKITQKDFDYAVECLLDCRQEDAKEYGFNYPYFTPGGGYGKQWWQLDSSLALCGYKWIDREFAKTSLKNFIESQKENGRICLWGADVIPSSVAGNDSPKQGEEVSSLPKIFDVAYHILLGTDDKELKNATYNMLKKYLDWWFSYRQDRKSGLITAVFEETFIPYLGCTGEYAPVDTNTEVYVACHYVGLLAEELGKEEDLKALKERKEKLKNSINKYLWDEEKGAYFPYDVREKKNIDCLMASTFDPLRLCIADEEKRKRLIRLLTDHEHFNWDTIPLTSVSKLDDAFTTTVGKYSGNASWSGNVWSIPNEMVIRGLLDCGENALAAELALKTVNTFRSNCAEFVNPFDGVGHGVQKYAWTASQYIELIVEVIFGISYNVKKSEVVISPNLTDDLKESVISLSGAMLSADDSIDVTIDHGKVTYKISNEKINVRIVDC